MSSADIPEPPFASAPAEPEDEQPVSRGFGGRGAEHGAPVPPPVAERPAFLPHELGSQAREDSSWAVPPTPPFEASAFPAPVVLPPLGEAPQSPVTGSIIFQDPETTVRHEPTLAESRARYQAEQEAERQREEEALREENKRKWRRRLIGGVAVVGVVGLVALVYVASPEQRCYDDYQRQEVPSYYCNTSYHGSGGVYIFHSTGWWGSPPSGYHSLSGGSSGRSYSGGSSSDGRSSGSKGGSVDRGGFNPSGKGSSSS